MYHKCMVRLCRWRAEKVCAANEHDYEFFLCRYHYWLKSTFDLRFQIHFMTYVWDLPNGGLKGSAK